MISKRVVKAELLRQLSAAGIRGYTEKDKRYTVQWSSKKFAVVITEKAGEVTYPPDWAVYEVTKNTVMSGDNYAVTMIKLMLSER